MDLRQLRYFVEILEQGSFTKAAQALNVAQPALSLHIKNMEAELGALLLLRERTGVSPTEAGNLLARRARLILGDLDQTIDEVRNLDRDPSGEVRIGLPGTISGILALPLIQALRQHSPRIKLTIAEAMSGFIANWLDEGRIDLAVLYQDLDRSSFCSEPLLQEELVALAGPQWPLPARLDLTELRDVALVLPSAAHGLRALIDTALQPLDVKLNVVVEIDSYTNIKSLVSAGYGVSILPLHAVSQEVQAGTLAVSRFKSPGLMRSAHLVYPKQRLRTRAQQVVQDLLREVVSDLIAAGQWDGARWLQSEGSG